MKVNLKTVNKYFASQEVEANNLVETVKNETKGEVIKSQIETKNHKDYGKYYEVTIEEEFTNSKSVLENGF
ncbi:hypothetical protein [Aerococcus sp. 1KP-2016]|uniref:hypothetical protein n=1 Tax=Aerococcus sp. 1KP-2016 TaxID=1981982 RepID=UPI000B997FCF|nr:hypothetical protein [Aerococcus sp. 1KP-2016]OYQ68292.1 hypothetical protein B9P78_00340 [Aerococcus sp. 1KP-2016]